MANAKILVVEDEDRQAEYIQYKLKSLGYSVTALASSGEEAIQKATETQPDLVLMDIMLKGDVDGVEATEQIRNRLDIPVIYLTAYADDNTLQRAKVTEPFGYMLKPIEERELHITIEITLYKHKMERKLKENKQWLATTLKSIGDAVIATDAEGFVTFMNSIAEALTGWKQEEAFGKDLREVFNIINEETRTITEGPITKAIGEGIVLIAKDGTEVSIAGSAAPIRDDKVNITGVVLVFRDITKQKQMEKALRRAHDELEIRVQERTAELAKVNEALKVEITERKRMEEELLKAQKLESLGVLAGGIAHDFNNLLTAIVGNISLIKMHANPEDKMYKRLTEAERACLKVKGLTQQLVTFSRGGAPIKKISSITELIKDSASFALSGSNVRCEFSISDDLWMVEVDEVQISQVINNLVINADQAMPGGGIIKVSAENITVGAEHALPIKEGRYVRVKIEDHGIGIPEEYLSRIFDPYFTMKHGRSGLGLATAYSITKSHDGYIGVESELGIGTKFYIYLPATERKIEREREGEKMEVIGGRGRVLLMDDEEIIREVAGEMLSQIGYEVEFARDGAEAIELYRESRRSNKSFDIVIMDLTVAGGMGGREAIGKLLNIDPEVRAIVSSGYSNDPVMSEYRRYGFRGVVPKPYTTEELGKTIYKVMNEAMSKQGS